MTKTVCDICGKEMEKPHDYSIGLKNKKFNISSYGRIWDICNECCGELNRWLAGKAKEREEEEWKYY